MITTAAPISLPMTPPLSLHSLSSVKQEISIASVSPDKLSHGIEGNATDRPDSTSRAADTDEQLSLLDVSAAFKSEALALPPSTFASEGSFKHVREPKGYVSGFNFFAIRVRATMSHEFAHLANNEVNKIIGKLWRDLPKNKKAVFLKKAHNDKIRYLQELHVYNTFHGGSIVPKIDPPPGYGLDGQPSKFLQSPSKSQAENLFEAGVVKKRRGRRKKVDTESGDTTSAGAPKVMRPRTAYSLFAHQERLFLAGLKCGDMQRTMGKYLGMRWKAMDPEEKKLYEILEATGATTKY